jgi:hypothetical protein
MDALASKNPPPTSQPCSYAEVASQPPNQRLQSAELVYVRKGGVGAPLAPPYAGPCRVVQPGQKYFIVDIGGRHESVSADRLKPHLGSSSALPAAPPRRGRPPGRPPLASPALSVEDGLDLGGAHVEVSPRGRRRASPERENPPRVVQ